MHRLLPTILIAISVAMVSIVTTEADDPKTDLMKVMPPEKPHPSGTLLFAIFPFDGQHFNERTATAWEFVPDRMEEPLVKRCVFRKSSWTARPVSADSPDLIRLQVNDGPRPYSVRLYHIDYATWKVRTLYSGRQVGATGRVGNRTYLRTSEGLKVLDIPSGKLAESEVARVLAAKERHWLVRLVGGKVALFDPVSGNVERELKDFPRSDWPVQLDPTGRHAVVRGSYRNKAGLPVNVLAFGQPRMISQAISLYDLETGKRKDLTARVIGRGGSGRGVIPSGPELAFTKGQLRFTSALEGVKPGAFRYGKDEEWVAIDLATQKVVARLARSDWEPPTEPSPVPDYLKELCENLPGPVYGRHHDLALAALVHHGAVDAEVARKPGEIRFVFAVLSPEGDSLLTQQGENLHYFDFKARTHRKVPIPEDLRGGGDACAVRIPPGQHAPTVQATKKLPVEAADEYEKLYRLRIQYFTRAIAIMKSIVDAASAEEAAKNWRSLLPLEVEIKKLDEKLGPPHAERQAELTKKYETRINELRVNLAQQTVRLANKPYYKRMHIAQLQNAADQGDKNAEKALKIMLDPEARAAYEAERKAAEAKRKAAIKTDPAVERAVTAYIETTKQLGTLLDGVTDRASAKAALPEAMKLVKKWETQSKTINDFGPNAGTSVVKHEKELKKTMGALGAAWLRLSNNQETSEPLKETLEKIGKSWADA